MQVVRLPVQLRENSVLLEREKEKHRHIFQTVICENVLRQLHRDDYCNYVGVDVRTLMNTFALFRPTIFQRAPGKHVE